MAGQSVASAAPSRTMPASCASASTAGRIDPMRAASSSAWSRSIVQRDLLGIVLVRWARVSAIRARSAVSPSRSLAKPHGPFARALSVARRAADDAAPVDEVARLGLAQVPYRPRQRRRCGSSAIVRSHSRRPGARGGPGGRGSRWGAGDRQPPATYAGIESPPPSPPCRGVRALPRACRRAGHARGLRERSPRGAFGGSRSAP